MLYSRISLTLLTFTRISLESLFILKYFTVVRSVWSRRESSHNRQIEQPSKRPTVYVDANHMTAGSNNGKNPQTFL